MLDTLNMQTYFLAYKKTCIFRKYLINAAKQEDLGQTNTGLQTADEGHNCLAELNLCLFAEDDQ